MFPCTEKLKEGKGWQAGLHHSHQMSLHLAWTRDEKAKVKIRLHEVTILVLRP